MRPSRSVRRGAPLTPDQAVLISSDTSAPGRGRPYRAVVNAIGSRYNDPYAGRRGLGRWQARTFTGKDYWSAEIVRPFETLAALPQAKTAWRFDVRR